MCAQPADSSPDEEYVSDGDVGMKFTTRPEDQVPRTSASNFVARKVRDPATAAGLKGSQWSGSMNTSIYVRDTNEDYEILPCLHV